MLQIHVDRVRRAQKLMADRNMDAMMLVTHDDYIYFFGEDRFQPRALIPRDGDPIVITFRGEEAEIRRRFGGTPVKIFSSLAQQMKDVVDILKERGLQEATVGFQMWFETPYFMIELFKKTNPRVTVVNSGPVMDELRKIKEPDELAKMRHAAELAAIGMRAAAEYIKPGITENEVAAEIEHAMRKAGGEGVGGPVFVNSGERSFWLHGTATAKRIETGDLVVVDLLPRYEGYLTNLARTFVVGAPNTEQERLFDAYYHAQRAALSAIRPGVKMSEIDRAAWDVITEYGFGEHFVHGMSHGIGLRFEETPAPTIHPAHVSHRLERGMTVTAGHSVLSVPNIGGVRLEDTLLVTGDGFAPITELPTGLIRL